MNFLDLNNVPVSVSYENMKNFKITAIFTSKNCDLDLSLEAFPEYVQMWKPLIFFGLCVLITFCGFYSLSKYTIEDNHSFIFLLSENAILMNLFMDLVFLMINLTFSMRLYQEFLELF